MFFTACVLRDLRHHVPSALSCPALKSSPFCHISTGSEGSASGVRFPFKQAHLGLLACLLAFRLVGWLVFINCFNLSHFSSTVQHCFISQNRKLWLMDPEIVVVNIFVQILSFEVSVKKRYKVTVC